MSSKVEVYNDVTWIPHHERYARDTQAAEDFAKYYHISASNARVIAAQTKIVSVIPKYPEIYLLLGTYLRKSWSRFAVPENYLTQQSFTSYIAPSLGPPEKQEADIRKIENYLRQEVGIETFDLEGEGGDPLVDQGRAIAVMLKKGVKENNELVRFITERMRSFIPV